MASAAGLLQTQAPRPATRLSLVRPSGAAPPLSWDPCDLEIVPAWLHFAPDTDPISGGGHYSAAECLDRELGPVAGLEARCRLIQARLIAQFLSRRLWLPLGFARLRDYSAERLGLAARTLEEDARVVHALETLPRISTAFVARRITWTHVRLLTAVATAGDEDAWLELARSHTTRELEALVNEKLRSVKAADSDAGASPATPHPRGDTGQSDVSSETPCPPRNPATPQTGGSTTAAAQHGADTGQSDVSSDTPCPPRNPATPQTGGSTAAAAQHGADTGSDAERDTSAETSQPHDDADPMLRWTIHCSREGRRLWRATCEMASRMAGSRLALWQAAECIAAEAMSAAPQTQASYAKASAGTAAPPPQPAADSWRMRAERNIEAFREECGTAEGFPYLDPLAPGPALPAQLEALLDDIGDAGAFELDRRLRVVRSAMQRIDWQLGTILRCVVDHKLHQTLGFATFRLYVEARLGISGRKAWGLVRLERYSLRRSSELRLAYRRGEISWLAATTLLPVISEKYQHEWIQRAGQVTLRRLADEVSWALDRMDEPGGAHSQPPPPIDLDVGADAMARVDERRVQMRAQGASQEQADPLARGNSVGALITLQAPASVIGLLEDAIASHRGCGEQRGRAFERIVAHAFLSWTAQPRHRDPVFARDNWICQVPACSSRCHLNDHHLIYLSHGGSNAIDNRVTICASHHLHGVHAGILRASGHAPHAVVWELGCLGQTRPLLRTIGDRYLDR